MIGNHEMDVDTHPAALSSTEPELDNLNTTETPVTPVKAAKKRKIGDQQAAEDEVMEIGSKSTLLYYRVILTSV